MTKATKNKRSKYEAKRESERARNAETSAKGRDIGEIPPVRNRRRRNRGIKSFKYFCRAYFADAFYLPWSKDHNEAIRKIECAVATGGLFAHAMPRGSGKTTLTMVACIWAVLTGRCSFVCLIAASADKAKNLLANIKTWLETNELLLDDFPEAIFPIRALGRIANRQAGQTHNGKPTRIAWNADKIIMPTIEGCAASGAILATSGMKGSDIRGQIHVLASGETKRPDLAIIDDPQTRESAMSETQCRQREAILAGDILGMAGPGKKIAAVMPCTVIRAGDMADSILDRDKHPLWQGERTKMVDKFPTNEKLWEQYREIRGDSFRSGGDGGEATKFYRKHRKAMDAGAAVAWAERKNNDELSALQHAMNLMFRDKAAFFAEYQNEPLLDELGDSEQLTADQIAEKTNGLDRRLLPIATSHLVAMIDVQKKALFYVVAGFDDAFTGAIVDYGTWPDQKRVDFTLRNSRITLAMKFPRAGLEGSIYGGLGVACSELLGVEWKREDGANLRIERCLIDANWGESTDVVYQFCRQSEFASVLMPSHGRFVGASSIPYSEYRRKPGDRLGQNWRVPNVRGKRAIRYVSFDTYFWKSFLYSRLAVAVGDRGCLSIFGRQPGRHRLFASHLTAEYCVRTTGRGREVDEWKERPERPDNHWFDCAVGCCVAASMQGASLTESGQSAKPAKRNRISLAEIQRQRRGG